MVVLDASQFGSKVYNLSSGRVFAQWLSERQRRSLAKDEEYRRRVELLQDFDFPTASQCLRMSPDGQYVVATGTYPPQVKVYEVGELSMKFERHLDAEIRDFLVLSEGYEKLVFLQADRSLAFHAAYGAHTSLRVPKFCRTLAYQAESCDLLVAGDGGEVYRLNLDEGRFREPFQLSGDSGVNKLALCPVHQLLAAGTESDGVLFADARMQSQGGRGAGFLSSVALRPGAEDEVTSLDFEEGGLLLAVGTAAGRCLLYDLRSSRPLLEKEHANGLPLLDVRFHNGGTGGERRVLSTDSMLMKIWDRDDGSMVANVETPSAINGVCVARDVLAGGEGTDSGVVMLAGEQTRVMSFYIPALGPAPRWCSFLDNLTEELEEKSAGTVYDDYKFITKAEAEEIGAASLIGTPLLRAYMHGFFLDIKLYNRLRAVSQPFAYENYRKQKIKEKVEERAKNRIAPRRKAPKVNAALAERLMAKQDDAGDGDDAMDMANPLGDDRFAALFKSADFEVDPTSEEYHRVHPSGRGEAKGTAGERNQDSDVDSVDGGRGRVATAYMHAGASSGLDLGQAARSSEQKSQRKQGTKKSLYALQSAEDAKDIIERAAGVRGASLGATEADGRFTKTLAERVEAVREEEDARIGDRLVNLKQGGGGITREFQFIPKSDRKKSVGGSRGGGRGDNKNKSTGGASKRGRRMDR
jgi:ribosome biogenesis protein ENP2